MKIEQEFGSGWGESDKESKKSCAPSKRYGTRGQRGAASALSPGLTSTPVSNWFDSWGVGHPGHRYAMIENLLSPKTGADLFSKSPHSWFGALSSPWAKLSEQALGTNPWADFGDALAVTENSKEFVVNIATPGVDKKDISINVRENKDGSAQLDVSWRRETKSKSSAENVLWLGKTWSSSSQSIPVPSECDRDAIRADMHNGSLVVTMPKITAGKSASTKVRNISLR